MDIYDPEDGSLDYDKARGAASTAAQITHEPTRKANFAELTAAALIDIAASLNVVALEAMLAMPRDPEETDAEGITEGEVDDRTRDFLVVGDLVHIVGESDPYEVVKLGFDQGEAFADIVGPDGTGGRYYVRNLERIIGDEGSVNEVIRASIDAMHKATGDALDGAVPVDEVDEDFTPTDEALVRADDPLALLEAAEAKRKASKKGGKK